MENDGHFTQPFFSNTLGRRGRSIAFVLWFENLCRAAQLQSCQMGKSEESSHTEKRCGSRYIIRKFSSAFAEQVYFYATRTYSIGVVRIFRPIRS